MTPAELTAVADDIRTRQAALTKAAEGLSRNLRAAVSDFGQHEDAAFLWAALAHDCIGELSGCEAGRKLALEAIAVHARKEAASVDR